MIPGLEGKAHKKTRSGGQRQVNSFLSPPKLRLVFRRVYGLGFRVQQGLGPCRSIWLPCGHVQNQNAAYDTPTPRILRKLGTPLVPCSCSRPLSVMPAAPRTAHSARQHFPRTSSPTRDYVYHMTASSPASLPELQPAHTLQHDVGACASRRGDIPSVDASAPTDGHLQPPCCHCSRTLLPLPCLLPLACKPAAQPRDEDSLRNSQHQD